MYGRIGKMVALSGQRDALAAILFGSSQAMPGCLSYVIATDPADHDALWITEVWDSAASHKKSLTLPAVQAAIRERQTTHRRLRQHSGDDADRRLRAAKSRTA